MQIHAPDPSYTGSVDAHANFREAVLVAFAFVAVLAVIHAAGAWLGLGLQRFGVHPRDVAGLAGIVAAPLLHGDLAHLLSNALPLLVAGTAMLHLYPDSSRIVLPAVYAGPGVAVWLFGRDSAALRRERPRVRPRQLHLRRGTAAARPARDRGVAARRVHVRDAGLGRVPDQGRHVVGDASRGGDHRRRARASPCARRDVPPRKRYSWEIEEDPASAAPDGEEPWREPV